NRAHLDMKYDADTALGLNWAGLISVQTSYDWDPATLVPGAAAVVGVEAPVWSETVANLRDVEFVAMPRLAALAEVAWSPQAARRWDGFRVRLGAQAPRWTALGLNFYRAPEVPWARERKVSTPNFQLPTPNFQAPPDVRNLGVGSWKLGVGVTKSLSVPAGCTSF